MYTLFTHAKPLCLLIGLFLISNSILLNASSEFSEEDFFSFSCNGNLIDDGDFEDGDIKKYWQDYGNIWHTSDEYTGHQAVAMNYNSGNAGVYQIEGASSGNTYSISLYAKSSSSNSKVFLRFLDSGYNVIESITRSVTSSSYTEYSISGTAPSGTYYIKVGAYNNASGTLYVDSYCVQNWNLSNNPSCSNTCSSTSDFNEDVMYIDPTGSGNGWLGYNNSSLEVCNNGDGTYTIQGNVVNGHDAAGWGGTGVSCGAQDGWYIDLTISDRQTWTQFQGSYEEDPSAPNHEDWDYWNVSGTYTGTGCNSGKTVEISGPSSGYRLQVGWGANSNDPAKFGFATWFSATMNGSYVGTDLYSAFDPSCYEVCDNLTSGGIVGVEQVACGSSYDPETIQNVALPSGGSGNIEYLWLKSTTTCVAPNGNNNSEWQEIAGAINASYDPGTITETTCYIRCSRRDGCVEYAGESNVVTIELETNGPSITINAENTNICGTDEIVLTTTVSNSPTCGQAGESDCNHTLESYTGWVENPSHAAYCGQNYGAKLWTKSGEGTSSVTIDFGYEVPAGTQICVNMKLEHCSNTSSNYSDAKIQASTSPSTGFSDLNSSETFTSTNYHEYCYTLSSAARYVKVIDNGKCAFRVDYVRFETEGTYNNSVTYLWTGPGIVGPTNEATATVNQAGTYAVEITDCTGCSASDDILITSDADFQANAGADQEICSGEDAVLTAVEVVGATYEWMLDGSAAVISTNRSVTVSPTETTTYVVRVVKNGCEDSDGVTVSVNQSLEVTEVITSNSNCDMLGSITVFFLDNATRTQFELSINGGASFPYTINDNSGFYKIDNLNVGSYDIKARWAGGDCPIDLGTSNIIYSCNTEEFFVDLQPESFTTCPETLITEDVSTNDSYNSALPVDGYTLVSVPGSGTFDFQPSGSFNYSNVEVVTETFDYEICITKFKEEIPAEDCSDKIKTMTVIYEGTSGVTVEVTNKDGSTSFATFNNVQNGDILTITNNTGIYNGKYNNWAFNINGSENTLIHTSCSIDILGMTFGDFYVAEYISPFGAINTMFEELCGQSTATLIVTVPEVGIDPIDDQCVDGSPVQLTATPGGGTFSGNGVDASGLFDPNAAGVGTHTITYTYTDDLGCTNSVSIGIVVEDLPNVTLNPAGPFCLDDNPVQLEGFPSGGTYSGNGVSSTGLFTPSVSNIGDNVITYSFTSLENCTGIAETIIIVNEGPDGGSINGNESNCGGFDPGLISNISSPSGSECAGIEITGEDCCDVGDKPNELVLLYNGESCSDSNNSQGDIGGKWDCTGDALGDPNVFISVNNNQFAGNVGLNGSFSVSNGGANLTNPIVLSVYDENGGNLLQTVEIHTSCSAPITVGDQFGSLTLVSSSFENGYTCGSDASLSYAWEKKVGSGEWNLIEGENGIELDPFFISATTQYRRATTNCCGTDYSNIITKTVFPPVFANAGPDQVICSDFSANLSGSIGLSGDAYGFVLKAEPESNSVNNSVKFTKSGSNGPRLLVYVNGSSTPITLFATKTARIESVNTDHNHDDPKVGYDGSEHDRSLFDFDISSISGTIDLAQLVLNSESSKTINAGVYPITMQWDAASVTWDESNSTSTWNTPGVVNQGDPLLDEILINSSGNFAWDVTSQVDAWVNGISNPPGNYTYSWNNGLGNGPNKTVSPSVTTTYTLTVIDGNGCSDTDQVTIEVSAETLNGGQIGPNQESCEAFDPEIINNIQDATGECNISTIEDCCDSGDKPTSFVLLYNGESCANSNNNQGTIGGKWDCNGGALGDENVYISVNNGQFSGAVGLNQTFEVTNGGSNLTNPIVVSVYSEQNGTLLQTVEIHTSCSAPISTGDQFGSLILLESTFSNGFVCEGINNVILYQWQVDINGTWTDISGATNTTYDPELISETTSYRRLAMNCCGEEPSNVVTISVYDGAQVSLDPAGPLCLNSGTIQLNGSPSGGIYSGTGVSTSGAFDPELAGVGTHTITYTLVDGNNCSSSASIDIVVNDIPVVSLDPAGPFCLTDPAYQLIGSPEDGTFEGPGASIDGIFEPSEAGVGLHTITYTYSDINSCTNTASIDILVNPTPTVSASNDGPITATRTTVQLSANSDAIAPSWSWSGPNNFSSIEQNPTTNAGGTYTVVVTDESGCTNVASTIVTEELTGPSAPNCAETSFLYDNNVTVNGNNVSFDIRLTSNLTSYPIPTETYPLAFSGPVIISIPEAVSWDGYIGRAATTAQPFEQWKVVFIKDGQPIYQTGYTEDLADEVISDEWVGSLMGDVYFPNGVDEILVVHYEDETFGEGPQVTPNSVLPSTICFDFNPCDIEVVATANPNPACDGDDVVLSASATGGSGDYLYEWSDNLGNTSSVSVSAVSASKTYYVTVTDTNGCDMVGSVHLEVNNKAKVGDFVWSDSNYDGIQDENENGINGVLVTLYNADETFADEKTTYTNGAHDGYYDFDVCAGEYYIIFGEVANTTRSPKGATSDDKDSDANELTGRTDNFVLLPGDLNRNVDAGYASVADLKLIKTVDNPTPNVGERVNFTIIVTNDGPNNATNVVITDIVPDGYTNISIDQGTVNGSIVTFSNLTILNSQSIQLSLSAEVLAPTDENTSYVNLAEVTGSDQYDPDSTPGNGADTNNNGIVGSEDPDGSQDPEDEDDGDDALVIVNGAVSGTVLEDIDNDDIGDTPIVGIGIELLDSDGNTYGTTTTNAQGYYEFPEVAPGEYTVVEQAEVEIDPDYVDVFDGDESPEDGVDVVDDANDDVIIAIVNPGEIDADNNFVEEQFGSISGFVSLDTDNDDLADAPQAGVTVTLTDNDTGETVTTETGDDGSYTFEGLEPGDYTVTTGDPTGGQSVSDEDEDPDGDAADADQTVDNSIGVTLTPGEDDIENNFVDEVLGTISGIVLEDTDNDDIGDSPIVGLEISLLDEDANTTITTLTGDDGSYEFTGLEAGEYKLTEQDETVADPDYVDVFDGDESPEDADDAVDNLNDDMIAVTLEAGEIDADNNFVEEQLGSISGFVSLDTDNDDLADAPQAGVTVTLTDNDTGETVTTETGDDGSYTFEGLEPGDYTVTTGDPTGGQSVSDEDEDPDGDAADADQTVDNSIGVTLTPGEDDIENNFVDEVLGTISGIVLEDTDNDDIGDSPIVGLEISLLDEDANTTITTLTGDDGSYEFTGLEAGEYKLTEQDETVADPDYVDVFDGDESPEDADDAVDNLNDDMIAVTLEAGEIDADNNFVEEQLGSISGFVSLDTDNDDLADAPQAGVTVTLTDNDTGETVTTETGDDGSYTFEGLEPGDYTVTTGDPTGGQSVSDEDEDPDGDAADADQTVDNSIGVTLTPGEDDIENNFVDEVLGTISGIVLEDTDNDDIGDSPIVGLEISLLDEDANTTITTLTGDDGSYEFTGLEAGEYKLTEQDETVADPDYVDVFDGDESPEDADDAVDNLNDDMIAVTLEAGEIDADNNFVEEQLGSISGFVSLDTDNDDLADAPQAGVTVTLTDNDTGETVTTETGDDGSYTFEGLEPGDYTVTTGDPTGGQSVSDEDEDPDGDAADADQTVDNSIGVTLTPGEDDIENNFVDEVLGTISGIVLEDTDNDDIGDSPIVGLEISLLDEDANTTITTLTGDDGSYEFTGLEAGEYKLTEQDETVADPDYVDVFDGDESPEDADDAVDNLNDDMIAVTLEAGEIDADNNFVEELNLADLNLIKTVNNATPLVGEPITFFITISNDGPDDATGVSVEDVVPDGYGNINSISNEGTINVDNTIVWDDLSIANGGRIILSFIAEVNAPGDGIDYVNLAEITSMDQRDPDSTPGNGADTNGNGLVGSEDQDSSQDPEDEDDGDDAIVNVQVPGITVEKYTNGIDADVAPGVYILYQNGTQKPVTWTYTVTNNGNTDLSNVVVSDDIEGQVCVIPFLAAGGSQTCTLVGIATPGQYTNLATAVGQPVDEVGNPVGGTISDNDPSNYFGVVFNVDIEADKTSVCAGEDVLYSVYVRMLSGAPGFSFRNIVVTDDQYPTPITVDSPEYVSGDTDNDGYLDFEEGEWLFQYTLTVNSTTTNNVEDMFDFYVNEDFIESMMGMNSVTVTENPELCAKIGDFVWVDEDGDGIQDPNEDGINGMVVNLYEDSDMNGLPDGGVIQSVVTAMNGTTGNDGFYQFMGLLPNSYLVQVVDPSGLYNNSPKGDGSNPTLDSNIEPTTGFSDPITVVYGTNDQTIDAGLYLPASIGDLVWDDADGDGIQDLNTESGIPNATVTLKNADGSDVIDADGQPVGPEITASDGSYSFGNLVPGDYKVFFATPNGYLPTTADVNGNNTDATDDNTDSDVVDGMSHVITLTSGETDNRIDAGFFLPGSIGDYVWNDEDADGRQEVGENGVNGIPVSLYKDDNMDGTPDGVALETTTTIDNPDGSGGTGYYIFDELPSGKYLVGFDLTGYEVSPINQGGDDTEDSDVIASTSLSPTVDLGPGEDDPTIDAGIYIGGELGDLVWEDNPFGIPDVYDPGIDALFLDVEVILYRENELGEFEEIARDFTDQNGYLFDNLPKGTYQVQFIAPAPYVFVTQDQGGNDELDSDANTNGLTEPIMLAAGESNLTIDAGLGLPPVPVELVEFAGKWNEELNINELDWITSSEINNDIFEIERSLDQHEFVKIGKVKGNGTTVDESHYDFEDRDIEENGIYFYRLKQIDYDGSFAYSDIIAIKVERNEIIDINVYPNPVADYLNIDIKAELTSNSSISVFDMSGRLISNQTLNEYTGTINNTIKIDVNTLPADIYNVVINIDDVIFQKQIIVIR